MAEHVFTDDEIRQIIDVINRTKHTQYIGARYVPIFGRVNEDSIEWDNSAPYEPLTIVLHQGNSYTSRQHVPAGVEITDGQYWANTGNYNAQVEQYRQEVRAFDGRITAADQTANNALSKATANEAEITEHDIRITTADQTANNALEKAAANETAIGGVSADVAQLTTANYANVVMHGADPTGATDSSDAIEHAIQNNKYGIYFPAGNYKITKTIRIPYHTVAPYCVMLHDNANIFAGSKLDIMLEIGAYDAKQGDCTEGFSVFGGKFNGNDVAGTAIKFDKTVRQSKISNVDLRYFTEYGIYIDSIPTDSSDTLINNIRVNRVQNPHTLPGTTAIHFAGCDNIVTDSYICDCETLIWSRGIVQVDTVHLYTDKRWYNANIDTSAIISFGGLLGSNIYIDSCTYPITVKSHCNINNLFIFNYFAEEKKSREYIRVEDNYSHIQNFTIGGQQNNDIILKNYTFDTDNLTFQENPATTMRFEVDCNARLAKSMEDRLVYQGGNRKPQPVVLNSNVTLPNAHDAIVLGYLPILSDTSEDYIGFARCSLTSITGFDVMTDSGILKAYGPTNTDSNKVQIMTFSVPEWVQAKYGIAIGVSETLNIYGASHTVRPVYFYVKNNNTHIPTLVLDLEFISKLGGWWLSGLPTVIRHLTTDNIIATLNQNGAL